MYWTIHSATQLHKFWKQKKIELRKKHRNSNVKVSTAIFNLLPKYFKELVLPEQNMLQNFSHIPCTQRYVIVLGGRGELRPSRNMWGVVFSVNKWNLNKTNTRSLDFKIPNFRCWGCKHLSVCVCVCVWRYVHMWSKHTHFKKRFCDFASLIIFALIYFR